MKKILLLPEKNYKVRESKNYKINRLVKLVANIVYKIANKCNFPIEWIINENLNFQRNVDLKKILKGKTIAVVWNSPSINKEEYLKEIDSHDIVIRLNKWWYSNNLNKNTWYRTDLWWIWNPKVLEIMDNILIKITILLSHPLDLTLINLYFFKLIYQFWLNIKYKVNLQNYTIMVENLSQGNTKFYPSAWYSMINTIIECDNFETLSIYGFTFNTDHRIDWNNRELVEFHNFNKEKKIILDLVNKNSKLSFY